jgi:CDP-paratose 2-epimerase
VNVLEAARNGGANPIVLFTSTNKVYGGMEDVGVVDEGSRYAYRDLPQGVSEERPLDFHSPYGCSKGAADQYVHDYARIYGLPTVVFRMSCIYGPHQFGTEDQGWVAHFLIRALRGEPITIYGDGKQVRDILFVEDLVEAFVRAEAQIDRLAGQAFNMGGGPASTISLMELMDLIEELHGRRLLLHAGGWRPGDQKYYVSDTTKFARATGWHARVGVQEGIGRLYAWLREMRGVEFVNHLKAKELTHGNHPKPVENNGKPTFVA